MSAAQNPQIKASAPASLYIGQKVRHQDDFKGHRVVGTVRMLNIEDGALKVEIALDQPIVIPADGDYPEVRLYRQYVPAHEVHAYDERDETIDDLLATLRDCKDYLVIDRNNFYETAVNPVTDAVTDPNDAELIAELDERLARIDAAITKAGGVL